MLQHQKLIVIWGMMSLNKVLQHYDDSQKDFVKKAYNKINLAVNKGIKTDLGFCDPAEKKIVVELANQYQGIKITSIGGYEGAERQKLIISDPFEVVNDQVSLYQINYNKKFNEIEHRHVLGTFINSDYDFNLFGDIIVDEDRNIQIVVDNVLAGVIEFMIPRIMNQKIEYQYIENITIKAPQNEVIIINSKSLRLDSIVKSLIKKSREKAQKKIKDGDVRINHVETKNINKKINESDLISIRGFGRVRIEQLDITAKERYRITVR